MHSVFTMLKQAREAKKLSLEDIADATYISVDLLKAVEEGKTTILPQAYVRAFIREYASVVGLNENDVMRRLDAAFAPAPPATAQKPVDKPEPPPRSVTPDPREASVPAETPASEEMHPPEPVQEEFQWAEPVHPARSTGPTRSVEPDRPSDVTPPPPEEPVEPPLLPEPVTPEPAFAEPPPSRPPRDLTSLIQKAAVLVGLAVIGIVIWNITGIEKPKTPQIPFQSVIKENEALAAGPALADSGALPLSPGARKDSLTLEARATDTVWVQLVIDDGPVREYIFRPNFRISWKAADRFVLTVGNAAAVHLVLNKKDLGALGRKGAVVQRLQLTRETLSRETPTR